MVTLTPQQNEFLTRLAKSGEGTELRAILDCYILALKDDCIFGNLDKQAAQAAIGKLTELKDRFAVLAGDKPATAKNQFV